MLLYWHWLYRTLQWRHNERVGVSNHRFHDCLLNRLFKAQIKENIKAPRYWRYDEHSAGEVRLKAMGKTSPYLITVKRQSCA